MTIQDAHNYFDKIKIDFQKLKKKNLENAFDFLKKKMKENPNESKIIEIAIKTATEYGKWELIFEIFQFYKSTFSLNFLQALANAIYYKKEKAKKDFICQSVDQSCTSFYEFEIESMEDINSIKLTILERKILKWMVQKVAQNSVLGRLEARFTFEYYSYYKMIMSIKALNQFMNSKSKSLDNNMDNLSLNNSNVDLELGKKQDFDFSVLNNDLKVLSDEDLLYYLKPLVKKLPKNKYLDKIKKIKLKKNKQYNDAFNNSINIFNHYESKKNFIEYNYNHENLKKAIPLNWNDIKNKKIAVLYEHNNFVESLLFYYGGKITSIKPGEYSSKPSVIDLINMETFKKNKIKFDLIICRWIISSWGLGSYGEKIDHNGDINLLKTLRSKLNHNGEVFFSLPIGNDCIISNLTRIYGNKRLPRLIGKEFKKVSIENLHRKKEKFRNSISKIVFDKYNLRHYFKISNEGYVK